VKFLLLLYGDEAAENAMTHAERRAIVERHIDWSKQLRQRGALVSSEALTAATQAAVVRGSRVSDGPFAETKEQLGGYYVVDCADRDEAIAIAGEAPPSPGLVVEVRPIADM
jgi:hypothetical protein